MHPSASRVANRYLAKTAKQIKTLWIVSNPNENSEIGDMVAEVNALQLGQIAIGVGASRWKHENTTLHDDPKTAVSDAFDRLKKFYKDGIPEWVLRDAGGEKGVRSWKPSRVAEGPVAPAAVGPVAPSAEELFVLPESSEVRELAESSAMTNVPEIAEDFAKETGESVSEAVDLAEDGPPTPEEIDKEPGGEEVSTLNRFLVEPPTDVEGKTAKLRRRYFGL